MKRWPHDLQGRTWMAFAGSALVFIVLAALVAKVTTMLLVALTAPDAVAEGVVRACGFLVGVAVAYLFSRLAYRVLAQPRHQDQTTSCGRCGYDLTGNTSNRCPECGIDDLQYVLWHFARRERLHRLKTATMVAFGIPLSLVGPFVLATIFWMAIRSGVWPFQFGSEAGWFSLFLVFTAVVVPLLYRLELQTQGEYMPSVLREVDVHAAPGLLATPGLTRDMAAVAIILANPRAASSIFIEFFLVGPRLAIGGWRQARLARCVHLVERKRAGLVVTMLLRRDSGMETAHLQNDGERKDELFPVLAYLALYEWVGLAKVWERVWLDSESRRILRPTSP